MPKKIDPKELKARIKAAKATMREAKKNITRGMAEMMNGTNKDAANLRAELSTFTKASAEVNKLTAKL